MELNYQQKVLLAAYEISKESGERNYEFSVYKDEIMFISPIILVGDKRRECRSMRVTNKAIFGDEFFVNELKRKLEEMF